MRKLIIEHFFLDYKFMLFGKERSRKRAASPIILAFFIGVFATLLLEPNPLFWVFWISFIVSIALGFFLHFFNDVEYEELDNWSQQLQYLHRPNKIGKDTTFPEGQYYNSELNRLTKIRKAKFLVYPNHKVINGIMPFLITISGMVIAYIIYKS